MLKKAVLARALPTAIIPDLDASLQFPVRLLAKRVIPKGTSSVSQVLVHWSGWPASMATWKDHVHLLQQFPATPAWGHAGSKEGGCYTCSRYSDGNKHTGRRCSPCVSLACEREDRIRMAVVEQEQENLNREQARRSRPLPGGAFLVPIPASFPLLIPGSNPEANKHRSGPHPSVAKRRGASGSFIVSQDQQGHAELPLCHATS
ncbi:hypothetical protein BS78_10G128000 [Paspalum vaginatum]|nr:hypothetical protein BS78_10G128000 [Paspalum vaginatum]